MGLENASLPPDHAAAQHLAASVWGRISCITTRFFPPCVCTRDSDTHEVTLFGNFTCKRAQEYVRGGRGVQGLDRWKVCPTQPPQTAGLSSVTSPSCPGPGLGGKTGKGSCQGASTETSAGLTGAHTTKVAIHHLKTYSTKDASKVSHQKHRASH